MLAGKALPSCLREIAGDREVRVVRILVVVLAAACSSVPAPGDVSAQAQADPKTEVGRLESVVAEHPHDYDARLHLGEAHYKLARAALDLHDEPTYLRHFEQASDAFVAAASIRPESAAPHTYLAMVDIYRGDIESALRSLRKAQRLAPVNPVVYTNLAQIYVYLDQPSRARRMLSRAEELRSPPENIGLNRILLAWKAGDMIEARDRFEALLATRPDFVQMWDEAPLSDTIETFDEFTRYCCGNPACGPYMRGPCDRADQEVREREATLEMLRREQQIVRERREKLRAIDRREREVTIEAEKPDPAGDPEKR
jgi:tetratricopeptide (TPR) repeat protein